MSDKTIYLRFNLFWKGNKLTPLDLHQKGFFDAPRKLHNIRNVDKHSNKLRTLHFPGCRKAAE